METLKVKIEDLPQTSKTPILTYCRKLIKEGIDPNIRLECFRGEKTEPDVIVTKIGLGAKLTVKDNKYGTPVFRPCKEFKIGQEGCTSPSPVSYFTLPATTLA
jgi:hypothetical protein